MGLEIDENFEVVNYDNSLLRQMKRENNTLDNGALCILGALDEFCDVQLEKYDGSIPYDKLFCALRQIIQSANDNENVRNALMTGLISEKRKNSLLRQKTPEVKTVKPEKKEEKVTYNKSAISLYAKKHSVSEIRTHFNFKDNNATMKYLRYHDISFVPEASDRKKYVEEYEKQLIELGKGMTLCEMARTLGKTKHAVCMFCMRHNIDYVDKGKNKRC